MKKRTNPPSNKPVGGFHRFMVWLDEVKAGAVISQKEQNGAVGSQDTDCKKDKQQEEDKRTIRFIRPRRKLCFLRGFSILYSL